MKPTAYRLPLLFLALLAMLFGLWAGLLRMGWPWPVIRPTLPISHGPLMVCGFFGALISLERAVALQQRWTYLGALFCGLGGLVLLAGVPGVWGPLLLSAGSLWFVFISLVILRRHAVLHTAVLAAGAVCWLVGSLIWLAGRPVNEIVLWWAGFLVFTIAGERLELSRVLRPSRRVHLAFVGAGTFLAAGLLLLFAFPAPGARLAGAGFLALALWLARFDIARFTVRKTGLTRYIAICLLTGYFWLGVGGLIALWKGSLSSGLFYDAMLHSIFLGFVFGMVFGHAPVIFPAVLNFPIDYRPAFYCPLALLQISLALRLLGDIIPWYPARLWGGLFNALAILAFFALLALNVLFRRRNS